MNMANLLHDVQGTQLTGAGHLCHKTWHVFISMKRTVIENSNEPTPPELVLETVVRTDLA